MIHPKKLLYDYCIKNFNDFPTYKCEYINGKYQPSVLLNNDMIFTSTLIYDTTKEATECYAEELYNNFTKKQLLIDSFESSLANNGANKNYETTDFDFIDQNVKTLYLYTSDGSLLIRTHMISTVEDLLVIHNSNPNTIWKF